MAPRQIISTSAPASASKAADHRDPLAAKAVQARMVGGVADEVGRKAAERRRPKILVGKTRGDDDVARVEHLAVVQRDPKPAATWFDPRDGAGVEIRERHLLEPDTVADEVLERQRIGPAQAGHGRISVER
jgi:hypothetical protein